MRFVWDPVKATVNRAKHRVDFRVAARVFLDPFALSEQDRIEGGEYRWRTIGLVEGFVVIVVAHTESDDEDGTEVIRIISARRAERYERARYEKERLGGIRP